MVAQTAYATADLLAAYWEHNLVAQTVRRSVVLRAAESAENSARLWVAPMVSCLADSLVEWTVVHLDAWMAVH